MSKQEVVTDQHWGSDIYSHRKADVVYDNDYDGYVVNFYEDDKLVRSTKMETRGVKHNNHYANDAAENWCLGYMK